MGPGGQHDCGGERANSSLLQEGCRFAGPDEVGHSGVVLPQGGAEVGGASGEADRFVAGDRGGEVLVAGSPAGDLEDLTADQRLACVDADIDRADETGQCVDVRGALIGHLLSGGDQDAQCGSIPVVAARMPQVLLVQ